MRLYTPEKISAFVNELFSKMGCNEQDAGVVAEVLLAAELRGIPSHGLVRITDYFQLWEAGRINTSPDIRIVHETPSTAVVNGDRSLGMIAGKKSMQIAIDKARIAGTGWVATRNSNHYGIAGYYAMMALSSDMIGIAMTNANPLVAPTFSVSRMLGTNPLAVAIPAGKQPPFVADFATTPIARGKLSLLEKKNEECIPGFVQDKDGASSVDPGILKQGGAMVTLGGDYAHGSHKGFCMSAIIDIFSSVFSGANFGPFVPPSVAYLPVLEKKVGEGTGHFFGAMRIDAFQEAAVFKSKMDEWIETFRTSKSGKDLPAVMIPGDPERLLEEKYAREGFSILPVVVDEVNAVAEKLQINSRIK